MIFPAKLKSMRTTTAYRALLGVGLAGVLGLGLVNLAGAQGNVCNPTRSSCVPGSYYNSQSSHPGLIGANWRMSYETVLYDFGGEIQILQADGRRLMFQPGIGQNAALCSSPQPLDGQVRIETPRDGRGPSTYHWRWADGRTLSFSGGSGGGFPLQAITAATGERVTLAYSPSGELTSIRDAQGRKLVFIYASAAEAAAQKRSRALKAIDTPLGRLTYSQDTLGRLNEVGQAHCLTKRSYPQVVVAEPCGDCRAITAEQPHQHSVFSRFAGFDRCGPMRIDKYCLQPVEHRSAG